MSTKLEFSD